MSKARNIILLDQKETPWVSFLSEYFEDTSSQLHFIFEPVKTAAALESAVPDVLFLNNEFLTPTMIQRLKVFRDLHPQSRFFHLGKIAKPIDGLSYHDVILEPQSLQNFQRQLVQTLPFPEKISILLIDDELEVARMMRDYFENRIRPSFDFYHAENGAEGLKCLETENFDIIILDIKMPVLDGREAFKEIKKRNIPTPVIIFFDAIFGDEMIEISRHGRAAVVEKGSWTSSMPEMMALIKKMVYFG